MCISNSNVTLTVRRHLTIFCFDDFFLSAIYLFQLYENDMANVIFEAMIDVICKQGEIGRAHV